MRKHMKHNSKRRKECPGKIYRWAKNHIENIERNKKRAEKAMDGLNKRKRK